MRPQNLVLIVPFHNEERRLPLLIESLRAQSVQNVPIVFVDNGSIDRSAALIAACEEIRCGQWTLLEERRTGKISALRTGMAFCQERFSPPSVGFVDADTTFADDTWVGRNLEILDAMPRDFGYTHSPVEYVGFDVMPVFRSAYFAYQRVIHKLQERVGWFAHGEAFVCSADTMARYFNDADITTEFDLRCSLLALSEGRRPCWNPSRVLASGRRIIVNPENFRAWSFYDRQFYVKKDINSSQKLNLDRPEEVHDLDPSMISCFFERRALKIASRNLVPLAIFDRTSSTRCRINEALGFDVLDGVHEIAGQLRDSLEWLFTDRFDDLVRMLEESRGTTRLARCLAGFMSEQYEEMSLSTAESHVN